MTAESRHIFKDLTAWFSDSVAEKRKNQWKKMGGKAASFDTAQFIFSENASSTDTEQIFQSEQYRDEHIAVFHAKYISDSYKSSKNLGIPVGKYFLPPKEIQSLVSKQMKYIWDDIDSGVSSDEESSPNKDHQRTPQKKIHSKQVDSVDNQVSQISDKQRQNNKTTDYSTSSSVNKQQNRKQQNVEKSIELSVHMERLGSPRSAITPSRGQTQGENLNKSTDSPEGRHQSREFSQRSTSLSPSESKRSKTNDNEQSYSLRKRTGKDYSETSDIYVDNIVLDNKESTAADNGHSSMYRHSRDRMKDNNKDYFCIEDLPKITSEMDDLIPGINGFEVTIKK